MTNYFLIASLGYVLMAAVSVLDKFILTSSLRRPSTYAFYSTIFFFGAFALLLFSESISFGGFLVALISALAFGFATWTMFVGLKYGEATHIIPFIGAVTAVFVYGLSAWLLNESLSSVQTVGIVVLVLASVIFSYEKNAKHQGFHTGFLWALLSGILFAVSHVTTKIFFNDFDFITGLVWTKGLVGVVGIMALFLASVRKDVFRPFVRQKNTTLVVVTNKVLAVLATVAIQYAIAIGSVTIVSGLVGLQYALILLLAYFLTIFKPKFFSEYFARGEAAVEVVAILLVVCGIFFLV